MPLLPFRASDLGVSFLLFADDPEVLGVLGDRLSSRRCAFLCGITGLWNFGGGRLPGMIAGAGSDSGSSMPCAEWSVKPFCCLRGEGEWYGKMGCVKPDPAALFALSVVEVTAGSSSSLFKVRSIIGTRAIADLEGRENVSAHIPHPQRPCAVRGCVISREEVGCRVDLLLPL